jgi:predicted ATPase/DNA-binding CsgD family transcriptional regulator
MYEQVRKDRCQEPPLLRIVAPRFGPLRYSRTQRYNVSRDAKGSMAPKRAKEDELLPNRSSESTDPRPLRIVGDGGDAPPGAASVEAPRVSLPVELTSFVGRKRELAEAETLLGTNRLLTITGPGGCGKTRLALRMAADLAEGFSAGTFFVGLASLIDPDLLSQAVARALGVRETPSLSLMEALKKRLQVDEVLLLMDNCEHLVDGCAELADALLRSCPNLKILATSREVLGVSGEVVWAVPPLSVPDDRDAASPETLLRHDAARLFVERAKSVAPAFALTEQNTSALARLCRGLDGMPLAIELAAAKVRVLSVEQISERLGDRFRLLATDSRTVVPRHKTLRATMDWSHDLLSDNERVLFRRLSVFAGEFTLEAAEQVCAGEGIKRDDVLDLLSRLVDRSLVVVEERGGAARYQLLETIRQYGQEKLNESTEGAVATKRRHALFFLELAEEAEPYMLGPEQDAWMERLELEHDNIRAALGWFGECGEAEPGLRLAGALRRFWWSRVYYTEGRAWLEEFLELAGASGRTAERAKALHALGVLIHRNADYSAGDQVVARSRMQESVEIYRELGDGPRTAAVLWDLGRLSNEAGDWETARSSLEESVELERRAGNERGVALARSSLGFTALLRGEHGPARAHVEESLRVLQELGSTDEAKRCLLFLGHLACDQGDYAAARARFAEMMEDAVVERNPWTAPFVLMAYAHLAAKEGQAARALRLAGAADAMQQTVGTSLGPAYQAYLRRDLERAWRALGEEEGAAAWEHGRAMTLEEAVAHALDEPATSREDEDAHHPSTAGAEVYPEPQPEGLTTREAEVLGLLAEGKTNKQIAAHLFLSVSTVQRHVANVYAKIEAHGRAEATAYAIRRGITRARLEEDSRSGSEPPD